MSLGTRVFVAGVFVLTASWPAATRAAERNERPTDLTGQVSGYATPPARADLCDADVLLPLPDVEVCIQGGPCAYTNADGNFVIPWEGSSPVVLETRLRGRHFQVFDYSQPDPYVPEVLVQTVVPPGPVQFVFNAGHHEFTRAQVNAYLQAGVAREFVLRYSPDFPGLATQTDFRIEVNAPGSCTSSYDTDPTSIRFSRAGGDCANFAFASLVYREYAHHLVEVAGSGQGQYGDGLADTLAALIADDPVIGWGAHSDCLVGLRSAENPFQYPCYDFG